MNEQENNQENEEILAEEENAPAGDSGIDGSSVDELKTGEANVDESNAGESKVDGSNVAELKADELNGDELNDDEINAVSSSAFIRSEEEIIEAGIEPPRFLIDAGLIDEAEKEQDPIFRELAEPKLPALERENRARLLMQTPTRLHFYWSLKNNPFQILHKTLRGNTGGYRLAAKLVNLKTEEERVIPVEPEGSWWFSVEPNSTYRAEIGFFAVNRPYIRIIYSNVVETPRKSPSPRVATDADFAVTARQFAEVLDVAGYRQDAFEVAMIGDDADRAAQATRDAFAKFTGARPEEFSTIDTDELRLALLAVASGVELKDVRANISPALFALLHSLAAKPSAENALDALSEHFDVFSEELFEEEIGPAVFGESLVNFPKRFGKRIVPKEILPKFAEKLSPLSSHVFRREF
jgi:hypothetical protein